MQQRPEGMDGFHEHFGPLAQRPQPWKTRQGALLGAQDPPSAKTEAEGSGSPSGWPSAAPSEISWTSKAGNVPGARSASSSLL